MPQVPGLRLREPNRRAVGIRAVVDGAIDVSDGVQADLDWVLDRERHMPGSEPGLAIHAAKGVHLIALPLQPQKDSA